MKKNQVKMIALGVLDIILLIMAVHLAFFMNPDSAALGYNPASRFIAVSAFVILKLMIYYGFNLYRTAWEYSGIDDILQLVWASLVSNGILLLYYLLVQREHAFRMYLSVSMADMVLLSINRMAYRFIAIRRRGAGWSDRGKKKVMVIGAGDAGASLIREMKSLRNMHYKPVVLIDDNVDKLGRRINGVTVLGNRYDIDHISRDKKIDEIIIAIPSAGKQELQGIVEQCKKTRCKLKTLPSLAELIEGKVSIKDMRDIRVEDLLGREEVQLETWGISEYLRGKTVLVTGGGGSIGSELCRQIAAFDPRQLLLLDIYENHVYELEKELKRKHKDLPVHIIIASVRDKERIEEVLEKTKPDVIFHAAAHKHVTLMEDHPKEAIKNNVFGTLNVAQAAERYGVRKFVLISTDKAVRPASVMGATKRICEMIIQSLDVNSKCEYVGVRFGNVLGSSGSVIPLFERQIAEGGPVTVTHEDVIRYFMTIPEAARLVIQAGAIAKGGEIFILDMGQPVRILKLAEDMIRLSGYKPYIDIPIEIIGLRPGEKLFEELLLEEEGVQSTLHNQIFVCKPLLMDHPALMKQLDELKRMLSEGNDEDIKDCIARIVPSYKRTMLDE